MTRENAKIWDIIFRPLCIDEIQGVHVKASSNKPNVAQNQNCKQYADIAYYGQHHQNEIQK